MASTPSCPIAGMADEERGFYAVQFHPGGDAYEAGHRDAATLSCSTSARPSPTWTMPNYIETAVARIREQVGNEEVILGLSGGVDSSVAAALIHRAIGPQLTCVFVDHGLLRLNEGQMVMDMFARNLGVKVIAVDASEISGDLKGLPTRAKRKIIGREFVEVFQAEAKKLPAAGGWRRAPSTPT